MLLDNILILDVLNTSSDFQFNNLLVDEQDTSSKCKISFSFFIHNNLIVDVHDYSSDLQDKILLVDMQETS